MKSFCALLSLLTLAVAGPVAQYSREQFPMELPTHYPGYSLDLGEMRLVELEGQSPVWMSELDKVHPSLRIHLGVLSPIPVLDTTEG